MPGRRRAEKRFPCRHGSRRGRFRAMRPGMIPKRPPPPHRQSQALAPPPTTPPASPARTRAPEFSLAVALLSPAFTPRRSDTGALIEVLLRDEAPGGRGGAGAAPHRAGGVYRPSGAAAAGRRSGHGAGDAGAAARAAHPGGRCGGAAGALGADPGCRSAGGAQRHRRPRPPAAVGGVCDRARDRAGAAYAVGRAPAARRPSRRRRGTRQAGGPGDAEGAARGPGGRDRRAALAAGRRPRRAAPGAYRRAAAELPRRAGDRRRCCAAPAARLYPAVPAPA